MGLQAGDVLGGKLKLERKLGDGAAGEVWAAHHLVMSSRVAVKVLDAAHLRVPNVVERFIREANSISRLDSPHIVTIHDTDVTPDGRPYIVMELLVGEDLGERMTRLGGRVPVSELREIVNQCARGLSVAHQRGIIHRDIKPANIYLMATQGGLLAKLLDFGLAKRLGADLSLTATNTLLGSPRYMSPEQIDDARAIDQRADLWSLSVVIYECLLGRPPFVGPTIVSLREAIAKGPPLPPRQLRPELPGAVDAWVRTAFALHIDERFRSADQLAEALRIATRGFRDVAATPRGRDLAIGPTAPHRALGFEQAALSANTGTMVMPEIDESDLASTVALDRDKPTPPNEQQPLASTVVDASLSAIPPSVGPHQLVQPGIEAYGPSSQAPSSASPSIPPAPSRSSPPANMHTFALAIGIAVALSVAALVAWVWMV